MNCVECGLEVKFQWAESMNNDLRERQMCFEDAFWARQLEHEGGIVTITFRHYRINPDDDAMKGFGGQKFYVTFVDGNEVETSNLWTQGEIPERWRDRFVPNASIESAWDRRQRANKGVGK